MENIDIGKLLEKFYQGETSLEEEALLESFFQKKCTDKSLSGGASFFSHLEAQKNLDSVDKIEEFVLNNVDLDKSVFARKSTNTGMRWLSVAASVLFFFLGYYYHSLATKEPTSISKVEALQDENRYLKKDLILTRLAMPSANNRIQGINSTSLVDHNDSEIIERLKDVLIKDENTNVRLAAAYAIYRHKDIDLARNALIQSLQSEKEPIIQLALINMMIAMDEREIMVTLKESLKASDVNPVVLEKIEKGLLKLDSI